MSINPENTPCDPYVIMKQVAYLFSAILLMVFPLIIKAQDNIIRISGHAPGYSGQEIVFHSWTDQISFTEKEIFRFTVDNSDEFSLEFESDASPLFIFSHAGRYFIYMYVEEGKDYRIVLPPKNEKALHESLNPYFEGIPTHIAVVNHDSTDLNSLIRSFDDFIEPLFQVSVTQMSHGQGKHYLDSVWAEIDYRFGDIQHSYFQGYSYYKTGLLERIAMFRTARGLSDNRFRNNPVLYGNNAYMELFNHVYDRYFLFFSRTVKGSRIFDDVNKKNSLSSLLNTLQTDTVLGKDRLMEMVILKGLHDSFYGSDFSRTGLLAVLDSLADNTIYPEHAQISSHIRKKVTRLLPGFDPPEFTLMDRQGNMKALSDYRGHYVYLNFCVAASYSCLSEYDILKRLKGNHGEYLKIVTVFIDKTHQAMLDFLGKNDYDWEFLFYGNQPTVLKDYDIRIFPWYYLIDRDGTLLMAPAPSPAEDFELYLFRTMRSRGEVM
jgi:hypothetical protein